MIGSISAQIALLAFASAIVAGLSAGNSPMTVLSRALVIMFLAMVVGKFGAWSTKMVLRDHLQKKKLAIDKSHVAAIEHVLQSAESPDESNTTVETG